MGYTATRSSKAPNHPEGTSRSHWGRNRTPGIQKLREETMGAGGSAYLGLSGAVGGPDRDQRAAPS